MRDTLATRRNPSRRGASLMIAVFVMAICALIVVTTLDTQTLQYASLRNTMDYDKARYLAEAGAQHALAFLEDDITATDDLDWTEFPIGSGDRYMAEVTDNGDGTITVTGIGEAGSVTRRLEILVKMGG